MDFQSCACSVKKREFPPTTKCQHQILNPTLETTSHSLWKKPIFNSMDHQHTSIDSYCSNCPLCSRANSSINCYFDFVNIHCKTSCLVNNVISIVSNVNIYSNLSIFYQNGHGVRIKLADIRCSFVLLNHYDRIILTKTRVSPNFLVNFRQDKNHSNSVYSRGGGVLIAINNSLVGSSVNPIASDR